MVTWEVMAKRNKEIAEMFEKKFIDYRNKMLDIHENLEESNPIRKEIETFMQDEQDDIDFTE